VVPHDGVDLVVTEVAQRHGVLKRRAVNATSQHRVIGVNVDVALVCEPLNSPLNQRRVVRMVTIALAGGITPVVILTKTDLADDLAADIAAARQVAPTARLIALSAIDDADDVREQLATVLGTGVTAVLFGPSGAGKSTLVNALFEADKQLVRDIRASGYGRHTTTASTLLDLPGGGCIIDTPGVRDLGVAEAVKAVDISFADLAELATSCRFHDCGHRTEPGCAIITAIALGNLDYERVESWRKLGREAEFEAARSDARIRRERSAQFKKMGKHYRSYQKANPKGR
ncbi:MAG: ribosome small subunit-dependent GTPase A, partial [Thermoleophilia bacterium]|nr:ribosome small subunit-dependent GTPase A [Thermoleophilia bacterium]